MEYRSTKSNSLNSPIDQPPPSPRTSDPTNAPTDANRQQALQSNLLDDFGSSCPIPAGEQLKIIAGRAEYAAMRRVAAGEASRIQLEDFLHD